MRRSAIVWVLLPCAFVACSSSTTAPHLPVGDGGVDTGTGSSLDAAQGDSTTATASDAGDAGDAGGSYAGGLQYLFCDIKRPLAGVDSMNLDENNYQVIVNGLKSGLGCNGVRIYIDPDIADPTSYPSLYTDVLEYVRSLGLSVYANPLGTGTFGMSNAQFAGWVVAYANQFRPDFLGAFNESGLGATDLESIAQQVKAGLSYAPNLVGPDAQKVAGSLVLAETPGLPGYFAVFGSHNANGDQGATTEAWQGLEQAAGRLTWSSENPRGWSVLNDAGVEIGVKAVVAAPISGLVLYEAFPASVAADGGLTAMGQGIAAGVLR